VLIADVNRRTAMAGSYENTCSTVFVQVLTLIGWNWLLDCATIRISRPCPLREPPPLVLCAAADG
jgi:hypothetical protein